MTTTLTKESVTRRRALEKRATAQAFWGALIMIWTIGLWFWAIFVVAQVVVTAILGRVLSEADGEVVISVGPVGPPQIFLFVMGIVTAAGYLTIHVASGGTRRSATRGWLLAAPAVGVGFAVVSTVTTALVRWLALVLPGWFGRSEAVAPFADAVAGTAALAILGTTAFLTGIAVNAVYRHLGGGRGTLCLPVVVAPLLLGHWLLVPDLANSSPAAGAGVGWLAWVAAVGLVAVAAAGVTLLLRRIPID